MFRKLAYILIIPALIIIASSCSNYSKMMKSNDYDLMYEAALDYYDQKDYYHAMNLFEQVVAAYRGTDKVEEIYYYYAYCYYHQEDYIVASYYFKRYAKSFPTNERAEECMFMSAYCYYLDSPRYSLDQTNTFEAIKEMQLFIDLFPFSARIETCNDLIDELRGKLEKKDFEIAKLYLKTGYYRAAIKAFNNVLKEYPDTQNKEEVLFFIVKAYYNYADNSIAEKQQERYQSAIEAYNDFIYLYPESEFGKEANNLNKNAYKQIEKHKKN